MSRRRRVIPVGEFSANITGLSHEGRGVASIGGKTTFIINALPTEDLEFEYSQVHGRYDEGVATHIIKPAATRVTPACIHTDSCGGCCLQHLVPSAQILHKQAVLLEQLAHMGQIQPRVVLPPLVSHDLGYRHKARLGVRWVARKNKVLVGFRERAQSRFLADIQSCKVLVPVFGDNIENLQLLIQSLSCKEAIPQLEIAHGDNDRAMIVRHLVPLTAEDKAKLIAFGQQYQIKILVQPGKPESIELLWAADNSPYLQYELPDFKLTYQFFPTDFTQVNPEINRQMVRQAINLLDPQPNETVLDLFCGLGNFTLPLATKAKWVLGIEGSAQMVERAYFNAQNNHINNIEFRAADLTRVLATQQFDKLLIDPPRAGAKEIVENIEKIAPKRIVYVACDPATLARDAGILASKGYVLSQAGVMDMFPHTAHVESIVVFDGKN